MWKHRKRALCLIALALAASLALGPLASAKRPGGSGSDKEAGYTIVSLDPNPNKSSSWANCINESSEIVGVIDGHAVYWIVDAEGIVVGPIPLTGFGSSYASHINENGEVVGSGAVSAGGPQNGLYWRDFTDEYPIVLPPLAGYNESGAIAINDNGLVVGWCTFPDEETDPAEVAVAWQINYVEDLAVGASPPVELDGPLPQSISIAYDVNNIGQVVGLSGGHAVRWQADVTDVGGVAMPVVTGRFNLSQLGGGSWHTASAINELGDIVGTGVNSDGRKNRGFFYDGIAGQMRELALLGRHAHQWPKGINDAAEVEVVGNITVFSPKGAAVGYTAVRWKGDKVIDLTKKIGGSDWVYITRANDVNGAGQIVGSGGIIGGETRAFAMLPK
ncbi:MAG: DUF3466 family protein [Planctomycetota bacterium]|jgi:uncharacterized membrane protein